MFHLVLASQSPRRQELIRLLGYPVSCVTAVVDEASVYDDDSAINVVKTAVLKATAVVDMMKKSGMDGGDPAIIIAADTIVALDGRQMGKPTDAVEARAMLRALGNRTHEVHTGITIMNMETWKQVQGVHTAVVTMRPYREDEIETYVASGDPLDKAGAYAIQHPTFRPVAHLDGCFTGVMGLSICHLIQLLAEMGIPIRAEATAVHQAHQQYPCPVFTDIAANLIP